MTEPQALAMIASWREDLRRARLALEACEQVGQTIAQFLTAPHAAIPHPRLVEIDRSLQRPSAEIAAVLIGYLQRGGRLAADQAADLESALSASRSRQAPTSP